MTGIFLEFELIIFYSRYRLFIESFFLKNQVIPKRLSIQSLNAETLSELKAFLCVSGIV